MDNLFGYDNKFFEVLEKLTDIVVLNFLFIISSVPIVTIGASLSAIYSVSMKMIKDEDVHIAKEYIKRFRENFKSSTIIWIFIMFIVVVLAIDFYISDMIVSKLIKTVFQYTFTLVGIILMFVITYIFPLISKFENTIKNTIKNSILISVQNLPNTIIMVLVNLSPIISILLCRDHLGYILFFYLIIGYGVIAYINSIFLDKILNRYI